VRVVGEVNAQHRVCRVRINATNDFCRRWSILVHRSITGGGACSKQRISPAVLEAWIKSGAELRRIGQNEHGELLVRDVPASGEILGLPAFLIKRPTRKQLQALPEPGVPFGLILEGHTAEDGGVRMVDIERFKSARFLRTNSETITIVDEDLSSLAKLNGLEHLEFGSIGATTPAGWKSLSKLENLRSLCLSTRGSAMIMALKEASRLPHLSSFSNGTLGGTTNPEMAAIAELSQLTSVRISHGGMTVDGMWHLKKLPCLVLCHSLIVG